MGNEVNIKYVLSLEEQLDKTLLLKKTPIDVREDAIFHLKSMSESYEYNICDMSRFFETLCPNGEKKYEVCFPSEYNQVDLNKFFATRPPFINPWDYRIEKKQKKDSWEKQHPKDATEEVWKKFLHFKEKAEKKNFYKTAEKYIKCFCLNETFRTLESNNTTKVYSTDKVGFSHFLYNISDDVDVDVFTNFGYGRSSFFYLTIKYKDIVLIPYSDLVKFYYANMIDFVSHTKSYRPKRDNWLFLMEYLSDFVNKSKSAPESFIKDFVLNEIQCMMNGLQNIVSDSKQVLDNFKNKQDSIRIGIVSPFNQYDFLMYKAMPDELARIFRVEKATGALHFIKNLKSFEIACPEVNEIIKKILNINKTIAPEIPELMESVEKSLIPLKQNLEEETRNLSKKEKEKERLDVKLKRCLSFYKDKQKREEREEKFLKENPRYISVQNEIEDIRSRLSESQMQIDSRNKFLDRLVSCRNIAEEFKLIPHYSV